MSNIATVLIDGSILEGGGQILRNAVSLSSLLAKPLSIRRIRNGRKPPGLKNQHRTGLELAAKIANAQLTGAKNGSTEIEFLPGRLDLPKDYTADSVTAGSTTLLSQIALPLLLFSPDHTPTPSTLTLLGGTNASNAPQIDYTKNLFLPFIQRHFGVNTIEMEIKKRGYFPKGGGEVFWSITPLPEGGKLRPITLLERGKLKWIAGISHYAGLPAVVGNGMVEGARQCLAEAGYRGDVKPAQGDSVETEVGPESVPISIECRREPNSLTRGGGSGIVLWAELDGGGIIGGSAIGRKGAEPEAVGREAAAELIKGLEDEGCVDEWLQDQIILFMALADGKSEVRCGKMGLSLHTETAIWLAEQLTDAKFDIEKEPSGTVIVRCQGIGFTAPSNPVESVDQ